jgi:AcrR family transcriptional regulator
MRPRKRTGIRKIHAGVSPPRVSSVTREAILEAAERVLVEHGYAEFTLRRVAAEASITVGNLTYHYATKIDLAKSMVDRTLVRYIDRLSEPLRDPTKDPGVEVAQRMRWLLGDAASPRVSRLFRELWAMASRHEFAAHALDTFYRRAVESMLNLYRQTNPALPAKQLLALGYLAAILSEGSTILFGTLSNSETLFRAVQETAVRAFLMALGSIDTPPPKT